MTPLSRFCLMTCAIVALVLGTSVTHAQTRAITYQGSLEEVGDYADGLYDFQFVVYDAETAGKQLAINTFEDLEVEDGLFTAQLEFLNDPFDDGDDRWLEIRVRRDGDPEYATLDPRTKFTSVPFAHLADHATTAHRADYALSGPFQPLDTTQKSRSGASANPNNIFLDYELIIDGAQYTDFEIEYPIELKRESTQFGLPQPIETVSIRLIRAFQANPNDPSQWSEHFRDLHEVDRLEIVMTANRTDEVEYRLERGGITDHTIFSKTDEGLFETITVVFEPSGFPSVSDVLNRFPISFNDLNSVIQTPFAGGKNAITPRSLNYRVDQDIPHHSVPTVLPSESRFIQLQGPPTSIQVEPIELIMNAFTPNNDYFDMFTQGQSVSLELRDAQNNRLWVAGTQAVITAWSIDQADDGGLFERFEFTYSFNP